MDYREIVAAAAERKLVELYKFFLDMLDELKQDQDDNIHKFRRALQECDDVNDVEPLVFFVETLSDSKKQQMRKKILDKANSLIRELQK